MALRFGALRNVFGCFGYDRHTTDSETIAVTIAAVFASCPLYKGRPVTFTVQSQSGPQTGDDGGWPSEMVARQGAPSLRDPLISYTKQLS